MTSRSVDPLLIWLLRASRQRRSPAAGLTLIECLVAIVVIAITVATITPPIFLASATRIQSRRAEQANQIAQGEIDRIRQIVERGNFQTVSLPEDAGSSRATDVAAATAVSTALLSPAACNTYPAATPVSNNQLVPVDVNGDCTPEFAMQVFRTNQCTPSGIPAPADGSPRIPYAFDLGVRVYTYRPGEAMNNLSKDRASLGLAAGKRDTGAARRPMQVLYTRVARVNDGDAVECVVGTLPAPTP